MVAAALLLRYPFHSKAATLLLLPLRVCPSPSRLVDLRTPTRRPTHATRRNFNPTVRGFCFCCVLLIVLCRAGSLALWLPRRAVALSRSARSWGARPKRTWAAALANASTSAAAEPEGFLGVFVVLPLHNIVKY